MEAISAMLVLMSMKPIHTPMNVYKRPAVPPLPNPNATVLRTASQVAIRMSAKPKMLTKPKFRCADIS